MTATGVLRHLADRLLANVPAAQLAEIAAMTDPEFWALLLSDVDASSVLRRFLRNPAAWSIRPGRADESEDVARSPVRFNLRRLYLDLPSRDGESMTADHLPGDLLMEPPDYFILEED